VCKWRGSGPDWGAERIRSQNIFDESRTSRGRQNGEIIMAESMKGLKRSCRCAEVTEANIGQELTLMG